MFRGEMHGNNIERRHEQCEVTSSAIVYIASAGGAGRLIRNKEAEVYDDNNLLRNHDK